MTSPRFPEPPAAVPPTPIAEVDAAVERVAANKKAWVDTGIPERIALLQQCLAGVAAVAEDWVRDMCRVKGLSPDETLAGEEWLAGPCHHRAQHPHVRSARCAPAASRSRRT